MYTVTHEVKHNIFSVADQELLTLLQSWVKCMSLYRNQQTESIFLELSQVIHSAETLDTQNVKPTFYTSTTQVMAFHLHQSYLLPEKEKKKPKCYNNNYK